jgi:hypothetical protein
MSEEEITLGASPTGDENTGEDAVEEKLPAKNVEPQKSMTSEAPDLSSEVSGKSDKEVLDLILSKSEEELIPWEPIWLPSRGLYYDGKVPNGEVSVKAMGLHADKILATQRLATSGYSLDYLYKHCVQLPNDFDPLDLISGDRIFILYFLRGITHGNIYEFAINCTNDDCKRLSTHMFDLNELSSTLKFPSRSESEPFRVILPYLSESAGKDFWVEVRFMRGKDERAMLSKRKQLKQITSTTAQSKTGPRFEQVTLDQTVEDNLNMLIVSAMGERDPSKISQLVSKMHARDTATIREFLRENMPGIDTSVDIHCPHCDEKISTGLSITESFFRPTESGGDGT